jgi:thymidylate kinase
VTSAEAHLAEGRSVVFDRFYASTIAYALARRDDGLPPAGDAAYAWPAELRRPDRMLQLVLPEAARLARRAARTDEAETREEAALRASAALAGRVREAFGRMGCVEVSAEGTTEEVVARVLAALA